ncbi:MAG: hypothetical protein WCQ21_29395 [Verrucomicrobiota bacterium]
MSKPTNRRKTGKAIQINPADNDHVVSGAGGRTRSPSARQIDAHSIVPKALSLYKKSDFEHITPACSHDLFG